MNSDKYVFTSESVSEGHPDKVADQISDAVLDACLGGDPESRVACETYTTTGMVLVGGEITTEQFVDVQEIARLGFSGNDLYQLPVSMVCALGISARLCAFDFFILCINSVINLLHWYSVSSFSSE